MAVKQSTIDKYVGKIFPSTYDGDMEIIEVLGAGKCKVKFLNNDNVKETQIKSVTDGEVRDLERRPIYKVGVMDIKGYLKKGTPNPKDYSIWNGMIQRCYNENLRHRQPTYEDCSVSENFKYFSKFKEWCNNQVGFNEKGWQLDKDILVKGNRTYSEDTCCFVPSEINSLIIKANNIRGKYPIGTYYEKDTGLLKVRISVEGKHKHVGRFNCELEAFLAYKQAKENYIKEVANKWKDQIDPRVYEALMNYQVEITD